MNRNYERHHHLRFGMAVSFSLEGSDFMNVFEAVKEAVTTRQAAEAYGIPVRRNGMCL